MSYSYKLFDSPVGELKLIASEKGLAAILWSDDNPARVRLNSLIWDTENPILLEAERQLRAYFAGNLKEFTLPLDPHGTAFQKRVWDALLTIPFGETRSYAQIARQIGTPTAYRAVGAANGRNPVSIVAPRMVRLRGSLAASPPNRSYSPWRAISQPPDRGDRQLATSSYTRKPP
jgi:methylated-DNA-[protein]-cysteine S-methyltransferase